MTAILSADGVYRWTLERDLGRPGPVVLVLGVNPSTADAEKNDATIRKDMGFGARLGWGRLLKGNKFGYRATDVRELRPLSLIEAVGWGNDKYLDDLMGRADLVVAAWGPLAKLPPHLRNRWKMVDAIATANGHDLMCFGVAQDGHPRHTLMLSYDTPLVPWVRP